MFAATTLATKVKSLSCSPSPYIGGLSSLMSEVINLGITTAY